MYYNVESINLKSKYETEEVKEFLGKFNLKYEDVDYTVVIREWRDYSNMFKKRKYPKMFCN